MRSATRGCTYLSPEISGHVVQQYLNPGRAGEGGSQLDALTRRERSIMRLIAEGRTNRDAAEVLHLSPKTIEKHRANVMRKLGLRSVAELAMLAVEARLIEPPSAVRRFAELASPKPSW
jgi:DNA-binding NarL/FixJ family response regulator